MSLCKFPSKNFYEGTIQNGVTIIERQLTRIDFPWPVPNRPMFFYVQVGNQIYVLLLFLMFVPYEFSRLCIIIKIICSKFKVIKSLCIIVEAYVLLSKSYV